jgi:hypothetical protein
VPAHRQIRAMRTTTARVHSHRRDLVIGCPPGQRLDVLGVVEYAAKVARCFAIRVAGPGHQSLRHVMDWCAEQDDEIELRMEQDLVFLAAGHEQHVGVFGGQEGSDGILPPPLAAIGQLLAPAVVSVDGLVPEVGQCADDAGLAGS